ncbi:MAG TPA: rhomboid family intramembrane serine protease [Vicinamibacterales bacterium]|nr:rhomboid family intramembrane serine protease [Vicinamibacterales bacterium]
MPRYPSRYTTGSVSFNPGPISTALKALIAANVAVFIAQKLSDPLLTALFGLRADSVVHKLWLWQPVTYMFLHGGIFHILFNMLALWMFGAQLEQMWGSRFFLKFYFVTGIGAALLTVLFSFLPFDFSQQLRYVPIIGASGAIYGLLLAYAMYFPDRPILLIIFWVPAKWCVAILGAIALYSSLGDAGGTANATHLFGLLVGYLYLKNGSVHPILEVRYRFNKWKLNRIRTRKKFDVYSGGRADDWNRRVH